MPGRAARAAIWLGIHGDSHGDVAQATGWFGRAERLLERGPPECAERGYLLVPAARKRLMTGDFEGGRALAAEAAAVAQRFGDGELLALAVHIEGRALLAAGRVAEGLARLDEAMIGVTADELSPQVTGLVYCSVLSACREVWALDRMREWTSTLTDWCASQPDMVAYTGECRVYHAEVLLRGGRWGEALTGARDAVERFAAGSQPSATGFAHYVEGEVHRLRGEFAAAEEAYGRATAAGYTPQPGLALLRLAQGDVESASAAIRRALAETPNRLRRARLLSAAVEIWLEEGDIERARGACDELAEAARACATEVLGSHLAQQRGALALAEDRPEEALAHLRPAWREWQALGAPWEAARTRVLLARACRALGDAEGAAMELEAARADFERLGASADVARIDRPAGRRGSRRDHGLTPREREVLALGRDRKDEPRGRAVALHQREDRGPARRQHLHQARPLVPRRGHRVRVRARPPGRLSRPRLHRNTHLPASSNLGNSSEARAVAVPRSWSRATLPRRYG